MTNIEKLISLMKWNHPNSLLHNYKEPYKYPTEL